jgi:transposase
MSNRRKSTMEVRTVLHHLRAGESNRRIAQQLPVDRRTVQRMRRWAEQEGLLTGALPEMERLHAAVGRLYAGEGPPQNQSRVQAYQEQVVRLRQEGHETAAIWERLKERGFTGSYSAVWRFVQKLEPALPEVTVRVETEPGLEAQVDFGSAGKLVDPTTGAVRKAWAFVMTLSWSRHQYVEFVFDQKVRTWLRCHVNAFTYFGGVPGRVVIDNLKAGITQACWHDPQVQHAYAECAEHYGFLIAPCRPATPRHKGKVEKGGVHYVKRNFLAGRESLCISQANREVLVWCETTAGLRSHGTTKEQPLVRFRETEAARLQPLSDAAYDLAEWKVAKLHRDCHVVFDNAYYSAPYRLVGQPLRVRGGIQSVRIFTLDYELVASHDRATQPGQRMTNPAHLPPELLDGLMTSREACRTSAEEIGPATWAVVAALLDDPVVDRVHTARRLLRLRERFGDPRLEAACARAVRFDDPSYRTVKQILETGQEAQRPEPQPIRAPARLFVRSAAELVSHLWGGESWL